MRAFLALPLPESARRAAAAARDALAAEGDGWRFVRDEGLHVTLRFLGEIDATRREACDPAWRAAASGVGRLALRLRGAACFPSTGRPRTLGLGVEDETTERRLALLASRLETAARAMGFPHETRPFTAHVTLARARGSARVARPQAVRIGQLPAFVAECVILYRSEPGCSGSRYYEEASYPLTCKDDR